MLRGTASFYAAGYFRNLRLAGVGQQHFPVCVVYSQRRFDMVLAQ